MTKYGPIYIKLKEGNVSTNSFFTCMIYYFYFILFNNNSCFNVIQFNEYIYIS